MATALHAAREALEELWQQGISGHELLRRQTRLADEFIIAHFNRSDAVREAKGKVALVALGGYGRGELYPFSDIDLLLLHDRGATKDMQGVAEAVLYPLWDSGYEVGHSVRTPEGAVSFAQDDFIFQVSLLDARFLAGSSELFTELRERYQKKILDGGRRKFVEVMEALRTERRQRYGSHSYLLEPQIKEGKGGLRDIQSMLWTGKAVFGLAGLFGMEHAGLLSRQERSSFEQSWNMLVRVRNRLHFLSQRKNDQLFFEYQEEIAEAFGYRGSEGMLGVEHFMREVYSHLQTIAVITDLLFEHVHEVVGYERAGRKERQLEKDIVLRDGAVRFAAGPEELARKPHLLLRLFLQAGKTGLPLHHRTRQLIRDNLALVDEHFREAKRAARCFLELLADSHEPQPVLEAMLETGLLTAYLPEFAGVESLAQHDLYHIYTVDRHLLETVGEMARLRQGSEGDLFRGLASPHLLLLAALLHDIGKGRGRDHSELGAEMVRILGARIGLEERELACLSFLVRFHLFLPENALRRDLEDLEFIRQSAEVVGDIDRLTMLYLLTVADSKATGPQAWSSWKASLVTDYYLRIKSCLEAACTVARWPVAVSREEARGAEWLRAQVAELVESAGTRISIDDLPDDYLLSFSAETVVHHLHLHREKAGLLRQKVLLFPEARQGYWSLLVMSHDRAGLLAKVCGVLALHNLRVLGAHIFTWPDQTAVDVLHVVPVAGVEFIDQDWPGLEKDINLAINYRLDVGLQLHQKIFAAGLRPKRQVQQLRQEVIIDNGASQRFTLIEVYAGDQPGTLYQLTQTISDFGLDIHRARIATEVEQLIDIFYVAGRDGRKLDDPAQIARLQDALLQIVHREEGAA
ncbi:MAG TPA: [protein-PII] uridylyltransferase [Desulfobulbaceae bacterium]|nr:[protein-PII] uridylyltransferase [Desulfobulbaceae bacterium]